MSRERRREFITVRYPDGRTELVAQRSKQSPSLGAVARHERVSDIVSSSGELLATCVPLGEVLGIVTARGPNLNPMYLLDERGFWLSTTDVDGTVQALGERPLQRATFHDRSGQRWTVDPAVMHEATRRARPSRPARIRAVLC